MKLSQMGISKNKISNIDKQFPVQDILNKTGQLAQFSSGVYAYDNIPFLVKKNIKDIVSRVLTKYGCVEVSLPILQPESIWMESGRLDKYVSDDVMFRTSTEKGNFCLAPTAEEAMVTFARTRLSSYKNLPVTFFQIGDKFRNELRSRGFLLRGKSFEMMDAYSFNRTNEELNNTYENIKNAYFEIFNKLGLDVLTVGADSGSIGGNKSEEFMILSDLGEDTILYDENTNKSINIELLERSDSNDYLSKVYGINDVSTLKPKRTLELGHIFQLGEKYSSTMNASYVDENGQSNPYVMGCYGIGVSRVLAIIYEKSVIYNSNHEVTGFSLPLNVSPYIIQMVVKREDKEKYLESYALYELLLENDVPVLFDDRDDLSIGSKIKDTKFMGTPYMAVFGNKMIDGKIEIENTKTGEKNFISREEFLQYFIELNKERFYNNEISLEKLIKKNNCLGQKVM